MKSFKPDAPEVAYPLTKSFTLVTNVKAVYYNCDTQTIEAVPVDGVAIMEFHDEEDNAIDNRLEYVISDNGGNFYPAWVHKEHYLGIVKNGLAPNPADYAEQIAEIKLAHTQTKAPARPQLVH